MEESVVPTVGTERGRGEQGAGFTVRVDGGTPYPGGRRKVRIKQPDSGVCFELTVPASGAVKIDVTDPEHRAWDLESWWDLDE